MTGGGGLSRFRSVWLLCFLHRLRAATGSSVAANAPRDSGAYPASGAGRNVISAKSNSLSNSFKKVTRRANVTVTATSHGF